MWPKLTLTSNILLQFSTFYIFTLFITNSVIFTLLVTLSCPHKLDVTICVVLYSCSWLGLGKHKKTSISKAKTLHVYLCKINYITPLEVVPMPNTSVRCLSLIVEKKLIWMNKVWKKKETKFSNELLMLLSKLKASGLW